MNGNLAAVRVRSRALIPPPRLKLSAWVEKILVLPSSVTALPGHCRLWPFQREILDAIGDPLIERITLIKPVRVGLSTMIVGAIGHFIANDPASILLLLPTEADARDSVVSDVEPIFAATPALREALSADLVGGDRNTLLSRRFAGGSLKVVAARAPRNLRRHTARILIIDEVDACEATAEGNPIDLAENRTLTFATRKIIIGSTPLSEDTSHVLRAYAESDGRVFEVPCPECGGCTELMWAHIEWPEGDPSGAKFRCPHCAALVEERHKAAMVAAGAWRRTRPEVNRHAGFRLNALVSLLPNTGWGALATKFIAAKDDTDKLQAFVNTILGQGWRESGEAVDEAELISRAEAFGLDSIPKEVLLITCGVDLQDDRIEVSIVGWSRKDEAYVLAHDIIWGAVDVDTTWAELDELLRSKWQHPLGGLIGIDAVAIDSGDGEWTQRVYNFCFPRAARHVLAIKGMFGNRPDIQASKGKMKGGGRLWIAGVDGIKTKIFSRLQRGQQIRFSHTLEPVYFEQLASERRVIRYKRGQPVRRFERISGRVRAEALDALVYSFAARAERSHFGFAARENYLRNPNAPRESIAAILARSIAQ
jgi:phage terminase large subunit GpA-like protein